MAIVGGCRSGWWCSVVTKVQRCSVFPVFVFVFMYLHMCMLLLLVVVGGLVEVVGGGWGVGWIIVEVDGDDGSLQFFWIGGGVKV